MVDETSEQKQLKNRVGATDLIRALTFAPDDSALRQGNVRLFDVAGECPVDNHRSFATLRMTAWE